jgi:hypothetical protein
MPQVWLTFDEIAEMFHCDSAEARSHVIANQWERRRCSDAVTRVELPPEHARQFMLDFAARNPAPDAAAREFDAAIATLRCVLSQVEPEAQVEALRRSRAS